MIARYETERRGLRVTYDDPREDPDFGQMGHWTDNVPHADAEHAVDLLIFSARHRVPRGHFFDIRLRAHGPTDDRRFLGLAWYYNCLMQTDPKAYPAMERVKVTRAVLNPFGGYLLVARMRNER